MKTNHSLATAVAGLLLCTSIGATAATTTRASCDAFTDADATLWARYLDSGDRVTFDVGIRLPTPDSATLNRTYNVFVDAQPVGQLQLRPREDGSASAHLSFNSYANVGLADAGETPFPPNWPGAVGGTLVRVGRLACALEG